MSDIKVYCQINDKIQEIESMPADMKYNPGYLLSQLKESHSAIESLQAELKEARREASVLAMNLYKRHYNTPEFELLDTVAGIITQIDTMSAGVSNELEEAREALKVAQQAMLEIKHAQDCGSEWYTNGASGLYKQVRLWIDKANTATGKALNKDKEHDGGN